VAHVPKEWLDVAFRREGSDWRLLPEHAEAVRFSEQDVRVTLPPGPFDLILCRNLVYTYFAASWQQELTRALVDRLTPGGLLVLGKGERLPADELELVQLDLQLPAFRRQ
jgi:chemotaxis protein methyltransferase CheR